MMADCIHQLDIYPALPDGYDGWWTFQAPR